MTKGSDPKSGSLFLFDQALMIFIALILKRDTFNCTSIVCKLKLKSTSKTCGINRLSEAWSESRQVWVRPTFFVDQLELRLRDKSASQIRICDEMAAFLIISVT